MKSWVANMVSPKGLVSSQRTNKRSIKGWYGKKPNTEYKRGDDAGGIFITRTKKRTMEKPSKIESKAVYKAQSSVTRKTDDVPLCLLTEDTSIWGLKISLSPPFDKHSQLHPRIQGSRGDILKKEGGGVDGDEKCTIDLWPSSTQKELIKRRKNWA